jgi:hypothetical protein
MNVVFFHRRYLMKVTLNWKKSEIMFVTNKQNIIIPEFIEINGNQVKVVSEFKLLGIIIDNKLNFIKNTCKLRKSINTRVYSIQKLFQLPMCVKIQFFKTFILAYFDYCATLCIYFPKFIIQKLANTYNNCIFKLFGTKTICGMIINNSDDFNNWNFLLYDKYGINSFQHRLLLRLSMFIYKILKFNDSPTNLVNTFKKNSQLNKRNENK